MKQIIAICVLGLLLVVPSISISAGHPLLESVRPLSMVVVKEDTGEAFMGNICTVSSINEKRQLWLTAAHCIEGDEPKYILGEPIEIIMRDVQNDIAVVKTPLAKLPALKLAQRGPKVEDRVKVSGYPLGYAYPFITTGWVANPFVVLDPRFAPFMIIQVTGAPGNSGSPIVNADNEIISVLQIGWGRLFSPMMGGATFQKLVQYASYWQ